MCKKTKRKTMCHAICILAWMILILIACFCFHHLNQELKEVQIDVDRIEEQSQSVMQSNNGAGVYNQTTEQIEYTHTLDFIENEVEKYREFAEKQQDFLLWIMGIIGTGLAVLFTFFEIKGRKDIEKIIREQYADRVQEEIVNVIGSEEKVRCLNSIIERERKAKKKKILFIMQKEESEELNDVYKRLKSRDYCVQKVRIDGTQDRGEIEKWTKEYKILIYQVFQDKGEQAASAQADQNYIQIVECSNSSKTFGILYTKERIKINDENVYIVVANYGLAVMERLFNLLYFV